MHTEFVKYINDPIYGGIGITAPELEIISTPIFQRLRNLRQLARVNLVFPGAEHSRFVHSLGVLYIMGLMTEHLFQKDLFSKDDVRKMRMAALLHDIGHYPLSHLGESIFGANSIDIQSIMIKNESSESQKSQPIFQLSAIHSKAAHHEQLGKELVIKNTELSKILQNNDFDPEQIASIFTGEIGSVNMPYSQLLHSSFDADRLDYLLRDSFQTGVRYGLVDLNYLIRLLSIEKLEKEERSVLVCNIKGQHVVEHFLMSRYFHYSQVIFHKTNVAFEGLLKVLYFKLIEAEKFLFNSYKEILENVDSPEFIRFTDESLLFAMQSYYDLTSDDDYKYLYEMFVGRIRPKVVFEMKDLYEDAPNYQFSILKWTLQRHPEKITELLQTERWGYQIAPVKIERIHGHNNLSLSKIEDHSEELREAIRIFNAKDNTAKYLAEDKFSVIGRLAYYNSEMIRIFVFDKDMTESKFERLHSKIRDYINSPK